MQTQTTSRRQFFGQLAAAVTAASFVGAGKANAEEALDETFCRSEAPWLCVDYPSSWHFSEQLVADLIYPLQLANLSNTAIEPHEGGGSPSPDLTLLPETGALLAIRASEFDAASEAPLRDGSGGIGQWGMDTVHVEGSTIETLIAWYRVEDVVYDLQVWLGRAFDDLATLEAIARSLRISSP